MSIVGSKLRNNATVLAYKEVGEMPFNSGPISESAPPTARAIVMAFTSEEAAQPFVTWRINPDGSTYWGHYYSTAKEAWADFNERW